LQYQFNIKSDNLNESFLIEKGIRLSVLKLDSIHPVISGNKIFKLHYFLEEAIKTGYKKLLTFGGAYSNHLVATANACQLNGIKSIGVVRGERPVILSHTLKQCLQYGMHLHFIARNQYDLNDKTALVKKLLNIYGECFIVPEGGYGFLGAKGAANIMNHVEANATHIACAVGTATTLAGLLMQVKSHQQLIAIPVLKGLNDIPERLLFLTGLKANAAQLHIEPSYHFDGYAKKNALLIAFMNELFSQHSIPTDFVYTAKMMYGILDMIRSDFFKPGSHIVCLHTGGLQGNLSLQKSTLTF